MLNTKPVKADACHGSVDVPEEDRMDMTTAVVLVIAANVVVMYLIKRRRDRLKKHHR